ncbi:ribonuclease H-like domain-containing protein [Vararia minispora EC-137]|uniref:Ribonuclease H-like domain-containing protein n=1 Tax=Vararia minispora EC-137 TaxID=1314806 RepID=A0ACB8QEZ1_9AGAM|nr:ribonuclease H-like domain-containing protein [Vararia minispora EC-137]
MSDLSNAIFDEYNGRLQAAALKATKNAASLSEDLSFYRSIDRDIAKQLDACSEKVLALTNSLLSLASSAKGKARLEHADDLTDLFESVVVETMDRLLEGADNALDRHTGKLKAPAISVRPQASKERGRTKMASSSTTPVVQHAAHLPKPQLKFKRGVDNTSTTAWAPSLKHKYNAQVPLGYGFRPEGEMMDGELLTNHPYRYEITNLVYPARMFQPLTPIPHKSFDDTPFTWVSTPAHFTVMLDHLRTVKEIAIDLEHHSLRSFGGFVCLMQISSREQDFVVDTLELRDELEELNEVFTDPNIVKVLHGAESDIVWLQQDFNLYIVNLFDTYHASKILDFPRHGLSTLLESYCDFTPDKRFQLADWRIRPLPTEMLHYARSDTHFLLFVYDNLRNALLDRALSRSQSRAQSPQQASTSRAASPGAVLLAPDTFVREVLARSAETALRVYVREQYSEVGDGPGGWDTLARKWSKLALFADGPGGMKREVYMAVHAWRDRVAREEDESTRYVLSNHHLFALAERPPPDMAGLLATFHTLPAVVRRRAGEMLDVIRTAVKRGLAAQPTVTPAPAAVSMPQTGKTPVQATSSETTDESPTSDAHPTTSLWLPSVPLAILAPHSSLLPNATFPTTMSSALFGDSLQAATRAQARSSRLQEIANRVHSNLAIVPSVPPPQDLSDPTPSELTMESAPLVGATSEIAYVPALQRQAIKPEVDDTIVVVGQTKKRRKRATVEETRAEKSSRRFPVETATDITPFDYASAPNILDDEPEQVTEAPRKNKRVKRGNSRISGSIAGTGKFPAPPRDRTQVKSGNVSHTFR